MTRRKTSTPRIAPEAKPRQPPAFVPPYPPSWLNRLIDWIDQRPGPAWIYYAAGILLLATGSTAVRWLQGQALGFALRPEALVYSIYPAYFVALTHYLDRQARSALERFRPALGASDTEYARIEYELTTVPARGAWIATALAIPIGTLMILVGEPEPLSLEGLPEKLVAIAYTAITVAAFFVLAFHTIRQLRKVSQLHATAPTINLLQPRPTYAFSRLTSRTAIGVLVFLYFDFLINPPTPGASLPFFTLSAAAVALVIAAFLLPLLGMHQRLGVEKALLEGEVNQGVELTYRELQQQVRSKAYAHVDDLEKALSGLLRMREVVIRLSTWPWQPGTLRGLVAAVFLPVFIWLVQYGLQRLLG